MKGLAVKYMTDVFFLSICVSFSRSSKRS